MIPAGPRHLPLIDHGLALLASRAGDVGSGLHSVHDLLQALSPRQFGAFSLTCGLLWKYEFLRSRAPCNPDPRTPPGSEESNGSGPPDVLRKTRGLASSWLFPHQQFTFLTSHLWFLLPCLEWISANCRNQNVEGSVRVRSVAKRRRVSTGAMERAGYRSKGFRTGS